MIGKIIDHESKLQVYIETSVLYGQRCVCVCERESLVPNRTVITKSLQV